MPAPIPVQSNRWDNEGLCAVPLGDARVATSDAPLANQAPSIESQPIPSIQLLSGSALRLICCCKHLAGPRRKLPGFLLSNPAGVIRIFEQLAEHSERSFRRIIVVDDGRI
jgi:hypothetical protein